MRGNVVQNVRQRATPEIGVVRNRHMVLAAALCGKPHVAARLASDTVAIGTQCTREVAAGEITWKSHALRGDHFVVDVM